MNGDGKKACLVSLGCSKNLVDSEVMAGELARAGYGLTDDEASADVLVVNTCGFVGEAKEESVGEILRLADYKERGGRTMLVVTGCLSQRYRSELASELPEVDYFIGTGEYRRIGEILAARPGERVHVGAPASFQGPSAPRILSTPPHYAYLKVAEGCSNLCTYCTIPSIRGAFGSRPEEAILEEARRLAGAGVKELNLVAQDTTSYGTDTGESLAALLGRLAALEGVEWLRLLYLYPGRLDGELIGAMRDEGKVLPYIDLPLQHISPRILGAMNRRYTREGVSSLIERLRREIPGVVLRTSLMVGFPGESADEFAELTRFVEDTRFDRLGVFRYSKEEGTPAYSLPGHVPEGVKQERYDRLMELQRGISLEKNLGLVGSRVRVLVDGVSDLSPELLVGRSEAQAPDVDGVTYLAAAPGIAPGDLVDATVTHAEEYDLIAEAAV